MGSKEDLIKIIDTEKDEIILINAKIEFTMLSSSVGEIALFGKDALWERTRKRIDELESNGCTIALQGYEKRNVLPLVGLGFIVGASAEIWDSVILAKFR